MKVKKSQLQRLVRAILKKILTDLNEAWTVKGEEEGHAPGTKWKTASGKIAAKNMAGVVRYFPNNRYAEETASIYARSGAAGTSMQQKVV